MGYAVTEHGVLFIPELVRAILDGRKTETRRLVDPQPWTNGTTEDGAPRYFWKHGKPKTDLEEDYLHADGRTIREKIVSISTWKVGDVLWVREAAKKASVGPGDNEISLKFHADGNGMDAEGRTYFVPKGAANPYQFTRTTPGIHMPRWASRISLEIVNVRAERLAEISDEDAMREGIFEVGRDHDVSLFVWSHRGERFFSPRNAFRDLWNSLRPGKLIFDRSPWVRVYSFRRIA